MIKILLRVLATGGRGNSELVVKETKRETLYELTTTIHAETRKLRLMNRLFKLRVRENMFETTST